MKANKLFQLTAPSNQMPTDIFQSLMKCLKLSILNENEFEYRAKYHNHEIGFALINGNLDVDVFGFNHKKEWIELEPNDSQINEMKRKLDNVETFQHEYRKEYQKNIMWQNGHKTEDFY